MNDHINSPHCLFFGLLKTREVADAFGSVGRAMMEKSGCLTLTPGG
jgi:hypothetical protein